MRETIQHAGLHTVEKDEQFREYMRELRERFPECNAKVPMTAEQIDALAEKSRLVIRSILERNGLRYA